MITKSGILYIETQISGEKIQTKAPCQISESEGKTVLRYREKELETETFLVLEEGRLTLRRKGTLLIFIEGAETRGTYPIGDFVLVDTKELQKQEKGFFLHYFLNLSGEKTEIELKVKWKDAR